MNAQIPEVVASYFKASNANDIDALVDCFSPDASVSDENQTHHGTAEIKAWSENVRKKFAFTTEMLSAIEGAGGLIVTAKLSGNFPGSPVDLDYKFTLNRDKISSLEIS
jgi:ketosteroid isomerase-like protein